MNAVPESETLYSACPHDCPSTCALEIERLDPWRIGRVRGAASNGLHRRGYLQQGGALRRTGSPPGPVDTPASPYRAGHLLAHRLGRSSRRGGGRLPAGHGALRSGDRVAVLLRGHHGPRAARWNQSPPARHAVFRTAFHHLHHPRVERLHRGHRPPRRCGSARDGEVRPRDHLGDQRGEHPGQRDDPMRCGRAGNRGARRSCASTCTGRRPRSRRTFSCASVRAPTARSRAP